MKRLTIFLAFFMLANVAFSSGLLTNTNQSAQFIRMMSRNASLDIDAVYFNPAGLTKLEDGWHFSLNNQSIFQTKTVDSKFPLLNDSYYEGTVVAPVFPSAFAVYKKDKLAFSLGFGPIGGGGSAEFARGMPSFEIPVSKLVPALAGLTQIDPAMDVQGYDADLYFTGSSIFWGLQLGATYEISDAFSVYGGVRYMPSKNTYEGSIRNIQLNVAGQMVGAADWMNGTAGVLNGQSAYYAGLAQDATDAADFAQEAVGQMNGIIGAGGGAFTLAQLVGAGYISAEDKADAEYGLTIIGYEQGVIDAMDINTMQVVYSGAEDQFRAGAAEATGGSLLLAGTAAGLAANAGEVGDKEVITEQTGVGFTPIIGINISPNEDLNIALKYEHQTYMTLTNSTEVDDLGLFPDGAESSSDVPGFLAVGVGYRGLDWVEAQFSYNMYFNKGVEWGNNVRNQAVREIEKNGYDVALGLQFNLSDNFAFSVGGLYGDQGVADSYQSDFSYTNPSFTPGAGIMWKITDQFTLDAGVSQTFYVDQEVTFFDPDISAYNETFGKETLAFAIGLTYSIF
jgi:long-chain fatty acid transport protein